MWMDGFRVERDSMGEMRVPESALYGASTARAVENFPISGRRAPRPLIQALGWIKQAAAEANGALDLLEADAASAIGEAARRVAAGELDGEFAVDVFQTGSGTSTNMNANEVIAHLAAQSLARRIHPNDDVNMCQSSNDVFPSAVHIAVKGELERALAPALDRLEQSLTKKAREFADILKSGRTHLQDAVPISLGQEFSGYAAQVAQVRRRVLQAADWVAELPLGGTAVGTGVNAHPEFAMRVIERVSSLGGLSLREAGNRFAAQACPDALVDVSAALRSSALTLMKVANDLRWLASGPTAGLGEIRLPAVQPGSSIMPGKINPVIAESLLMVCAAVVGNDAAVATAAQWSNFELHTMWPLLADRILESTAILSAAVDNFAVRLVDGVEADRKRCEDLLVHNPSVATVLAPTLGYDKVAAYVHDALSRGERVLQPGERDDVYKVAGEEVNKAWLIGPRR